MADFEAPQSRNEAILQNMLGAENELGDPLSRIEALLMQLLDVIQNIEDNAVTIEEQTPSITAESDTRYICGTVTSLSFIPSSSGICSVRFTSGTTPTVLTLPNTVVLPEWFDATSLESNTVYEISIADGVYGVVMTWES